jgi:glycosyltransferase involved in cell wall biosynthesis
MSYRGWKRLVHYIFEKSLLSLCTSVIIPSPYVRDVFKKIFPRKKIFYAELGVKQMPVHTVKYPKNNKELIFVGTVVNQRKGLHFLIEALNIIKGNGIDFNCTVVGMIREGKYYQLLKEKIKKYNLENNISFTGHIQDDKLADYYNAAAVFVFPSTLEGYGMVLIEAMAFGLPVIAFNNSAMPYTVKDGINGLLVKNKDIADLALKISTLLSDSALCSKLSQGALQTSLHTRKMSDMDVDIDKFLQDIK